MQFRVDVMTYETGGMMRTFDVAPQTSMKEFKAAIMKEAHALAAACPDESGEEDSLYPSVYQIVEVHSRRILFDWMNGWLQEPQADS